MDPVQWLEENERYFSEKMNGYDRPPIGPYITTLPLIDRDGKIADLGCGNGMLLKFLMLFSGHKLIPHGIDDKEKPLEQAVTEILPEFANNFKVVDVREYDFAEGPFTIIITNPFYAQPNLRQFTEACLANLTRDGKLIYRVHDDVLQRNGITSLDELQDFNGLGMRVSRGAGLVFGVFER